MGHMGRMGLMGGYLALDAAEAFFEVAEVHFDEGGAAMGAGVGHGALAEGLEEGFQFGAGEGVVGFDGVAADGFGDDGFAQAGGVDAGAGEAEFIHQFEGEAAWGRGFDEGGEGVEEEGLGAEFGEADTETGEGGEVFAEEGGVAGGEFEGFREEQALGGGLVVLFDAVEHLLVEDAFVGGVLIEEDKAAVGFEDHVESADDADQAEGEGEEGRGRAGLEWGWWGCGRGGNGRCRGSGLGEGR